MPSGASGALCGERRPLLGYEIVGLTLLGALFAFLENYPLAGPISVIAIMLVVIFFVVILNDSGSLPRSCCCSCCDVFVHSVLFLDFGLVEL